VQLATMFDNAERATHCNRFDSHFSFRAPLDAGPSRVVTHSRSGNDAAHVPMELGVRGSQHVTCMIDVTTAMRRVTMGRIARRRPFVAIRDNRVVPLATQASINDADHSKMRPGNVACGTMAPAVRHQARVRADA
jgi:hypothetical protein